MPIAKPGAPKGKKVARQITPKKSSLQQAKKEQPFSLNIGINKLLFTTTEQQSFLEDLATLIDDGVPANRAIEVIAKLAKGPRKFVVRSLQDKIAQGKPIADGMMGWFSQATIELVRAGEEGGTLAQNIRVAGEALGTKSETFQSLAGSLTYPLVVLITACGVLIYMKNSVFQQFASIKPINEWPKQGQELVALSDFLQAWWWLIIIVIFSIMGAIAYFLINFVGEDRKSIDNLPVISIYRQLVAARFMETLGLLISNGIVFKRALKILQHKASPYLSWHLMMMEFRLGRGRSNIAEVLDTGLVTRDNVLRLKAIAEAKGFEHALIRLGKFSAAQATSTVRKLGKVLGGVLLAISTMFAGFMVTTLYSVGSSLSGG